MNPIRRLSPSAMWMPDDWIEDGQLSKNTTHNKPALALTRAVWPTKIFANCWIALTSMR